MESNDLKRIVFSKRQEGNGLTKNFRDLNGEICLKTIKRWCKMIDQIGSVNIGYPTGCSNIVRTPSTIEKVKSRMKRRGRLSKELKISHISIQRILKDDLGYFPYKVIIKPFLTDAHKAERKTFAN